MNFEYEKSKQIDKLIRFQIGLSILFSGSAINFSFHGNTAVYVQFVLVLLIFCTVVYKFKAELPIYRDKANRYIISVITIIMISTVVNISSFAPTVTGRCILSVLQAFLLAYSFETGKEAIKEFVTVIRFFAITGVICWLIFVIGGVTRSWMPVIRSVSNSSVVYRSIFIHNFLEGTTRNSGPFWEPSIFAGFLILGMFLSHFVLQEKVKDIIPLIIALFSSQSSGGIMMFCVFVFLWIWDNNREDKSNEMILKIIIIAFMLAFIFFWERIQTFLLLINRDIFSKIIDATNSYESETRLMSFAVDFRIWRESPIFGVGVSNMEVRFLALRDILSKITNMAHTSTSSEYLAAFGMGGVWINWLWIKAIWQKGKTIVFNIGAICIFFIMLNEAPQINFVLTYFVLFSLLKLRYSHQIIKDN